MDCHSDINYVVMRNESFWDFKGKPSRVLVTRFETNRTIHFDKIGKLKSVHDEGKIVTYYNMTSYWKVDMIDQWPLMSSPFPMLAITAAYLLYVLKIGPAHMKNRHPYNLQNVIVVYNAVQVLVSAYLVYLSCQLSWPHGWVSKTCLLEREDTRYSLATIMYFYFLAKVSEVLDTIFFVLRKKFNQVTFLHVYHHAVMIVTSWGILKYEPTYPTLFIRNINSFVHVVMYTYYGLSSFPSLAKYLWWKKYITSLQLVQFTLILIHFTLTYATSECKPSFPLCFTVFWNTSFFLVLFSKFYRDTYKKNNLAKRKDKKENNGNAAGVTEKDNVHLTTSETNKQTSDVIHRKKMMNGN